MRRVRQSGRPGDEERDAGVAFPEALVRVAKAADHHRHARRRRRIGDVPDLVRRSAEAAQQVDLALVRAGQLAAVADAGHLRAARFAAARPGRLAGNMREVLRPLRIGDVDDRRAVVFLFPGERHWAASRRDGRRRRSSARPACGWWAGRRCGPAGRCSRRDPCCSSRPSAARPRRRPAAPGSRPPVGPS